MQKKRTRSAYHISSSTNSTIFCTLKKIWLHLIHLHLSLFYDIVIHKWPLMMRSSHCSFFYSFFFCSHELRPLLELDTTSGICRKNKKQVCVWRRWRRENEFLTANGLLTAWLVNDLINQNGEEPSGNLVTVWFVMDGVKWLFSNLGFCRFSAFFGN